MKVPSTIKRMTILTEFSRLGIFFYVFKQPRDNNDVFAVVLTDLSKVFDCINHELSLLN